MRTTITVEDDTKTSRNNAAGTSKFHRFTFRTPMVDVSTIEWWRAQDDPSLSLRMLIREDIRTHGVTDTANRRVEPSPVAPAHDSPAQPEKAPDSSKLQRNTPEIALLREFWDEFEQEFTWDLVPFTFLRDLYLAWISRVRPETAPLGRNLFISALREHVADNPNWFCPADPQSNTYIGDRMSCPEPLIQEYQLARWINHGAACRKGASCCTRQNHRGFLRKRTGRDSHAAQMARIKRLEAEIAELSAQMPSA
ncbi:hypothetical protein [Arthrobacter bambusae]|uniref:Uncharacterized protein n=1 Tax=Arthrobacter bambusae TaxID=1338426 RepID=A0AAW8D917_9MICC|nr:hypothetical protein [Arthrobacter bambusae]MDP9903124.1 hypothetical protein [Arthrobacter bambusae]MDQ0128882.1 hypothetical protein [Arthrobacter bambusae]MDQ0180223.1 hypothetical protein [Arthrobacter bambusae]